MSEASNILRDRVPFSVVISDDKLMGKLWKQLSIPQQVVLRAAYGLPFENDSERGAWAILNDSVSYDALYFPTSIKPVDYTPREYRFIIGLIGRRSGKSFMSCFAALYEIIFGGHTSPDYITPGQDVIVPYIAQDLPTAKSNMKVIWLLAQQVPKLKSQILKVMPDYIEFKNGIKVVAEPPAIKTGRGVAIPLAVLDEVGFWYKTSENANPDFEVVRAIRPSMFQFPNAKMFIISSPYTEEGILWKASRAGTGGKHAPMEDKAEYKDSLVMQASTAAMANPKYSGPGMRDQLEAEQASDPEGFVREYGARFVSAISGYLPQHLIVAAVDKGVKERTRSSNPVNIPFYVAAMDPAFRHDEWAFTIYHRDQYGKIVQDLLRVWTPNKKAGIVLNPADIMAEIASICEQWKIKVIYSDQYQLESLQQIAISLKLSIQGVDFTGRSKAQIYGSFLQLLRQGSIKLLDDPRLYQQLVMLQKRMGALGQVQIAAPPGRHDDIASATVLGAKIALSAYPRYVEPKKEPTLYQEGLDCIRRKRISTEQDGVWV